MVEIIQDSVVHILSNRIKIIDSYKITDKKVMGEILYALKYRHPEITFNRDDKILIKEWIAHNRLYRLGINSEKTKDVDLEFEENKLLIFIWNILGI